MQLRASNVARLTDACFDVLVVGGGINGAVSAAALSSKGVKVALIERLDFAGVTSQQSSNLAWGGIKYMETLEFPLVRDLCMSRNRLIRSYPSTVKEIRFLTTVSRGFRHHPAALWAGAWAYWLFGNCFTRTPRYLSRSAVRSLEPVVSTEDFAGAIEYSDAYLYDNDARFVFNFVRTALDRGAVASNYVESFGAERKDGLWCCQARDTVDGKDFEIRARVLVNAAGAFVDEHNALSTQTTEHRHVFSKGIHLLVDRVTPNQRVLAFFADDGRLFFVIPMGSKTCLGTTDTRVTSPDAEVTQVDRQFVLDNINRRLNLDRPIDTADIIAERCGVRPLVTRAADQTDRDFLQMSRRHEVETDRKTRHMSIFGGKLTDCINIGEEVCELVQSMGIELPRASYAWYGEAHAAVREEFFHQAALMGLDDYSAAHSTEALSTRLWRRYGARALQLLDRIREDPRQADILIAGTEFTRCEIDLAAQREMIVKLGDFLRRRSKIALMMRKEEIRCAAGLMDACRILFADAAEARIREYFDQN